MEGLEACAVCFIAVMFAPPEPNKHAVPWDRRRLLRDSAEDVCCVDKIICKVTARCSMQPSHSCVAAASGTGVVLGAGHIQHLLAADASICSTARRRVKYLSKRTRKRRAAS